MTTDIRNLTPADELELPETERAALALLRARIASGEIHPATSLLDLTPAELVDELLDH
jgi:hypothetical protein